MKSSRFAFLFIVLWTILCIGLFNYVDDKHKLEKEAYVFDVPTYSVKDDLYLLPVSKPKGFNPRLRYIGNFTCTAYCPCSQCCGIYANGRPTDEYGNPIVYGAAGQPLMPGVSVAVDPAVIPFGSILVIDNREYIAQDTGGFRGCHLDFYFSTHAEALAFGCQIKEVYIKEGGYYDG